MWRLSSSGNELTPNATIDNVRYFSVFGDNVHIDSIPELVVFPDCMSRVAIPIATGLSSARTLLA